MQDILDISRNSLSGTLADCRKYLAKFGDKLPAKLNGQLEALSERLNKA